MSPTKSAPLHPDPTVEKATLRKQAARHRSLLMANRPSADNDLLRHLDQVVECYGTGIFAAYVPIRSELSPLPIVNALTARGIATAMPVTPPPGGPLVFYRWAPGMELDEGPYNTKQPRISSEPVVPKVILAPLLAFDAGCWRLGYGGGFYDRSIAEIRGAGHEVAVIGIAFAGQQVDKVPTGPYDMALDAVWTPDAVIWRDAA